MKITLETIPHDKQRYETVGDWVIDPDGTIHIYVSEMGNDDYNFLVALHELVEVKLCQKAGVTQKQVDDFDMNYEAQRSKGLLPDTSEPGDDPEAPYRNQHSVATGVERMVGAFLDVVWDHYDRTVNSL